MVPVGHLHRITRSAGIARIAGVGGQHRRKLSPGNLVLAHPVCSRNRADVACRTISIKTADRDVLQGTYVLRAIIPIPRCIIN